MTADLLLFNGTVYAETQVLGKGYVAVRDGRIVQVDEGNPPSSLYASKE